MNTHKNQDSSECSSAADRPNTRVGKSRYFVDMIVDGQLYAVSSRDHNGKPWTKRKAQNATFKLNAGKYHQLDQPKGYFQVRESHI